MKRTLAAFGCACAALAFAAPAGALEVGATEDEGKVAPDATYGTMAELGMTKNVLSITWDPGNPTALPPDAAQIERLLPVAAARGVKVVFAVYQKRSNGFAAGGPMATAQFASWLATVARTFPSVREYIGPNEPNQPRFWNPQFAPDCTNASARGYLEVMAAMYDALKSVDPSLTVIGVALSPRGNDNCLATSNVSTSPVRFLHHLGRAYRASGRTAPFMDAFSFHPYPNVNTDAPARGYAWPNVGVPNLARLKQAIWDAFGGTGQPTVEEGLLLDLDEVGWQVDTSALAGYSGAENVPVIDEATQARYHADVVARAACDPSVRTLSFFHVVDEADRDRFQSGVLRRDGSRRPSFDAVKAAIGGAGTCSGQLVSWQHANRVVGAEADFGPLPKSSRKRRYWSFFVSADEEATFQAAIVRSGRVVTRASGLVRAHHTPLVRFPRRRLAPGTYSYRVTLRAAMNATRSSSFSSGTFVVE